MQVSTSVDEFLQSLGLEKYSITFQAEEVCKSDATLSFFMVFLMANTRLWILIFLLFLQVDLTALVHMSDEDLKAIGIPMVKCWRNFFVEMLCYLYYFFSLHCFYGPSRIPLVVLVDRRRSEFKFFCLILSSLSFTLSFCGLPWLWTGAKKEDTFSTRNKSLKSGSGIWLLPDFFM